MPSFDYTSRDYLSIKQDLLSRASDMLPEWTNRDSSDFGMVMVDLWAYIGDILHYYVDRAAAETYVGTAVNRESILALANLFDYRPAYQTSSTGTVTVSATNASHGDTIVIPEGTGFVAPASENLPVVYFTSTASASMGPNVGSVVIPVAEGRYVSNESPINAVTGNTYSNGTAGQRFNLRYTGAMASSIEVYVKEGPTVGGIPSSMQYFYTSSLTSAPSDSRAFDVEVSSDGVVQIVFGNGVNGKIPANGAEVVVSYRRGQGAAGNISEGRVTTYDTNQIVLNTYITTSSAMTGGTDAETLESMKANIPLMFRTQDRAVSLQDFKDLSLRIPQVVKATCSVVSTSNVMVYALPYQSDYLTTSATSITVPQIIKDEIISYFSSRTMVGASVGAANSVTLTPVNVSVDVHVKDNYVSYWVAEEVASAIDEFFAFENVSFGQTLAVGSLYRAMQSIDGVDYVIVTVFDTNSGTTNKTSITASSTALFRKGTVSIGTIGGVTGTFV